MTEVQETRIRELRMRGVGYRGIATEVGLSRDIVRNYCKSRGMDGYAEALKMNVSEQISAGKVCVCCGKTVEKPATGRPKRFCSDICRRRWWKVHPENGNKKETALYPLTCARCGKSFISYGNKKRKYCSHNCYIKDRFWREDEDGISTY